MKERSGLIVFPDDMNKAQEMIGIFNLLTLFFVTVVFFLFFKRGNILFQKNNPGAEKDRPGKTKGNHRQHHLRQAYPESNLTSMELLD